MYFTLGSMDVQTGHQGFVSPVNIRVLGKPKGFQAQPMNVVCVRTLVRARSATAAARDAERVFCIQAGFPMMAKLRAYPNCQVISPHSATF